MQYLVDDWLIYLLGPNIKNEIYPVPHTLGEIAPLYETVC